LDKREEEEEEEDGVRNEGEGEGEGDCGLSVFFDEERREESEDGFGEASR